ncbi:hypothetical protein, partial [Actinobacillus pleuropneumoniae]|uniref:hypothetical protein n=1 Tax=Actinobacillus pleuropneumoniae TaxID=715 RepID=UPI00227D27EE
SWTSVAWDLEQEGEVREGKNKRALGSKATIDFSCKYQGPCMISLLVLACMTHACAFLVIICHWHGGFLGLTIFLPSLSIS